MQKRKFTAIITKGEIAYVSYCPELGIASQGRTRAEAKANLKEAIGLYLEEAADTPRIARMAPPTVSTITI